MAHILEKYSEWTFGETKHDSKDGGLNAFDKDELLSIVTLYWMSNTITSSMRFYSENLQFKPEDLEMQRSIHKNSYL